MRILIANNVQIISNNYGGYGKQLHYLIKLFSEYGYDIFYFISKCKIDNDEPYNKPYSYEEMTYYYKKNDIKFIENDILKQITYFSAQQDDKNELNNNAINTIISENNIDSFFFLGDVFVFYVNKNIKINVPSYCWFPCHYYPFSEYDILGLNPFDNIICLSPSIKLLLEKKFPEKAVFYLPHINEEIDIKLSKTEIRAKWNISENRFIVTIISQIVYTDVCNRKAIDVQLIAFSEFNKKFPDSFLFFHSSSRPEDRAILENLIELLNLNENNFFWNDNKIFSEKDIAELYILSDVVLNCSKSEGFGVPIIEAQQYGTNVITSDFLSMAEHNFQNNVVKFSSITHHFSLNGHWTIPSSNNIISKLEELYSNSNEVNIKRAKWISKKLCSYENVKKHLFNIMNHNKMAIKKIELKQKYYSTRDNIIFIHIIDNNYNCIDKILLALSKINQEYNSRVIFYMPFKRIIKKNAMLSEFIIDNDSLIYNYNGINYSFPIPNNLNGDSVIEIEFTTTSLEHPVYNSESYKKLFDENIKYEIIDTFFENESVLQEHILLSDIYIPVSKPLCSLPVNTQRFNHFDELSLLSQSYKTYTLFLNDDFFTREYCIYGKIVTEYCNDFYYNIDEKKIEKVLRVDDVVSAINEYYDNLNNPFFSYKKEITKLLYS